MRSFRQFSEESLSQRMGREYKSGLGDCYEAAFHWILSLDENMREQLLKVAKSFSIRFYKVLHLSLVTIANRKRSYFYNNAFRKLYLFKVLHLSRALHYRQREKSSYFYNNAFRKLHLFDI